MSAAFDIVGWRTGARELLTRLETAPLDEFVKAMPAKKTDAGSWTFPYYAYQDLEARFWKVLDDGGLSSMRTGYVEWRQNTDRNLMDKTWIADADRDELSLLATSIRRGERFCDGTIAKAFESGVLAALLARLIEL